MEWFGKCYLYFRGHLQLISLKNLPGFFLTTITFKILYIYDQGNNWYINQLFIENFYAQIQFSKKWNSQWQKVHSSWQIHFLLPILFVLILVYNRVVLYGGSALSFVVLWTKKRYSSFLRKVLTFQKICFKVSHGGSNKKDIQLNLCNIFSILIFNELYLLFIWLMTLNLKYTYTDIQL